MEPSRQVTISRQEKGWRELDFNIGVAIGAGMTRDEQAEFASCDRSHIYNRIHANKDFIEFVANRVKVALATQIAITTENVRKKYAAMYEKAVLNLDEFLDDEDSKVRLQATFRMLDQQEGKPTQKIEQKVSVDQKTETTYKLDGGDMGLLLSLVRETAAVTARHQAAQIAGPSEIVIDDEPERDPAEGS